MSELYASFWDHLADLKRTVIKVGITVFLTFVLTLAFYQPLFTFLTSPLKEISSTPSLETYEIKQFNFSNTSSKPINFNLPDGGRILQESQVKHIELNTYSIEPGGYIDVELKQRETSLYLLSPVEGFLAMMKTAFWISLVASAPIWLIFVIHFLNPALKKKEKQLLLPFLFFSLLFLLLGGLFGIFVTIPFLNKYFYFWNLEFGQNIWSLSWYLDYSLSLILANSLAFEGALLLFLLVHFRIVDSRLLKEKRRHAILGAFIIGALLTPPDIPSQLFLALPLIAFYELSFLYAKIRERKLKNAY